MLGCSEQRLLCSAFRARLAMNYSTGKIAFFFQLAVLLSWLAAWVVARRFRAEMRRQMGAPTEAVQAAAPPTRAEMAAPGAARPVSLADNRRARWRLVALLAGLSGLMSATSALLFLCTSLGDLPWSWRRFTVLSLVQLWPVVPALGVLWRWSGWRLLMALAAWFAAGWLLVLSQSLQPEPAQALAYLSFEIGPPMLLVAAVCIGGANRAVAPWVLLPMLGLVAASQTGLDLGAHWADHPPPGFEAVLSALGAWPTIALLALLPWLLAWWPAKAMGRALAGAYQRKWLSDLMMLFTVVWGITLLAQALRAASDQGLGGAIMLLPLAWIPVAMLLVGALRRTTAGRPPTLLVLRVFQHDARIQALFDHLIERWRLTGNTVLIAGTDLVERTMSADDLFAFIDGSLAARFIRTPAEVTPRLAEFDLTPDLDGRYRINECYCHDATWQRALSALVERSDVVLMDLRSFRSHNRGCLHELQVLAAAARLPRVVVLTDGDTDLAAAREAVASAPAGRFVWIDTTRTGRSQRRELLQQLLQYLSVAARA
jgi:hypothetical protein